MQKNDMHNIVVATSKNNAMPGISHSLRWNITKQFYFFLWKMKSLRRLERLWHWHGVGRHNNIFPDLTTFQMAYKFSFATSYILICYMLDICIVVNAHIMTTEIAAGRYEVGRRGRWAEGGQEREVGSRMEDEVINEHGTDLWRAWWY